MAGENHTISLLSLTSSGLLELPAVARAQSLHPAGASDLLLPHEMSTSPPPPKGSPKEGFHIPPPRPWPSYLSSAFSLVRMSHVWFMCRDRGLPAGPFTPQVPSLPCELICVWFRNRPCLRTTPPSATALCPCPPIQPISLKEFSYTLQFLSS